MKKLYDSVWRVTGLKAYHVKVLNGTEQSKAIQSTAFEVYWMDAHDEKLKGFVGHVRIISYRTTNSL